jgi:hypothetical protein
MQGCQRLGHGIRHWNSAGLERDHHHIDIGTQGLRWDANGLYGTHASANQIVRQVCGPCEVIGDTAE